MIETNETLLKQLRKMDAHDAWQAFFRQYWAIIRRYTHKLGLNAHQGEEVLQEVMVELMRVLPEFDYDKTKGRFRNFLLTIVHRKSLLLLSQAKRQAHDHSRVHSSDIVEEKETGMAGAELRWRESIRDTVLERLRLVVDERTFAVFADYVLHGRPAAEVAQAHGLNVNAVYQIKNRLTRRLQHDTDALLRDSELG